MKKLSNNGWAIILLTVCLTQGCKDDNEPIIQEPNTTTQDICKKELRSFTWSSDNFSNTEMIGRYPDGRISFISNAEYSIGIEYGQVHDRISAIFIDGEKANLKYYPGLGGLPTQIERVDNGKPSFIYNIVYDGKKIVSIKSNTVDPPKNPTGSTTKLLYNPDGSLKSMVVKRTSHTGFIYQHDSTLSIESDNRLNPFMESSALQMYCVLQGIPYMLGDNNVTRVTYVDKIDNAKKTFERALIYNEEGSFRGYTETSSYSSKKKRFELSYE
jgi:hypothetical protein